MTTDPPDTLRPEQQAAVDAALALVGLTEDDDAYRAIVDPAGPFAEEVSVAHGVSSCMLVAAWLRGWRGRFVASTIQDTLRQLCGGTGRVPDADNFCGVGDGLWWAQTGAAPEHVDACVVAIERASVGLVTMVVVAGGRRVTQADVDGGAFAAAQLGKRCIEQVARAVRWSGSAWVDLDDGRHVRGVLDIG